MVTTPTYSLSQYAREFIKRGGPVVGYVFPIDGLSTTTVTCNILKRGEPATQYEGMYMVRRDATGAPADRVRVCTSFTGSTGVLGHSGANYADTTATNETLELINFDVTEIDQLANIVLAKIRRREEVELASSWGERYYLDDQDWIVGPTDVTKVTHVQSPIMNRNRTFTKWNGIYGATLPDWWDLNGAGSSCARSTTGARRGPVTAAVTRSGTNCYLSQNRGLLWDGTTTRSLQSKQVCAYVAGTSSSANQLRVNIDDGVTVTSSAYHTGGGGYEELTVTKTLAATATKCEIQVTNNGTDGTVYLDDAPLIYATAVQDVHRQNNYGRGVAVNPGVAQGGSPLSLYLDSKGPGSQYIVYSRRPYPQFTGTRITGGLADADTTDAPLVIVVTGMLAETFTALGNTDRPDASALAELGARYKMEFAQLCNAHLQADSEPNGGMKLKSKWGAPALRFGGRR